MLSQNEVKQKLYDALRALGCSEQEIDCYAVSLALGPVPIATIAQHLRMSRPNVYGLLAGLEHHGLAKLATRKRYARTFIVESPSVVLELLRARREGIADVDHHLTSAIPELLAQYHQGATPTKLRVLQGPEQYCEGLRMMIEEAREEIRFFGSAYDFSTFLSPGGAHVWLQDRLAGNIRVRALVLPGADAQLLRERDRYELRETRILINAPPFVTSFHCFANKALLWQPKAPLAVLLEDEYLVAMLGSMFEVLWMVAPSDEIPQTTTPSAR